MSDVTELLQLWNSGDDDARAKLIELIYPELQKVAQSHMARERSSDLQPGALINEAYLRLVKLNRVEWQSRTHFIAVSARIMREILVDAARKRFALKRDGGIRVTLSGLSGDLRDPATDALDLHDALERLAAIDPQRAYLVELRFFGGLTIDETAEVLSMSPATVNRSWAVARGWLYKEINRTEDETSHQSDTST